MPSPPTPPLINRRNLIRIGTGTLLGAVAAPLLSACGSGATTGKAGAKSEKLLPARTPLNTAVEPDLPGTAAGVPQGFYTYPDQPARSVRGKPLKGAKPVTFGTTTFLPPAPARSRNAAWRAIERRLGGRVEITAVPTDDHATKFNTQVASDNLPDLFTYPETGGVKNIQGFLRAKCADLTPHLSGEAIKDYPNLAAIPRTAWQKMIYDGKLYGIPITRTGTGGLGYYRHDLFEEAGVSSLDEITDMDRLFELFKEVTRPSKKQYAVVAGMTNTLAQLHGAPYFWKADPKTGKFTFDLETDAYRAAVEMARKLYEAGCYYPGTLGMTGAQKSQYTNLFKSGKGAYVYDGLPDYLTPTGYRHATERTDKSFDVRPFRPVGKDAVVWADSVILSRNFIKKASDERVKEILRLADWAAAPFGTEEYTLINYGVEGADHRRDSKGNPVLTKRGIQDIAVPFKFLASAVPAVYDPESKDGVRHLHGAYAEMIPKMVKDPTLSLTSPTWDADGLGSLHTLRQDGLKDIISGRKPLSYYDELVKEILGKGAEKARGEFEDAYAQGKKGNKK